MSFNNLRYLKTSRTVYSPQDAREGLVIRVKIILLSACYTGTQISALNPSQATSPFLDLERLFPGLTGMGGWFECESDELMQLSWERQVPARGTIGRLW
ncbi:hypothetical protein WG66_009767 [Moniliophthora roreri]|nr:hypothetical protein WG66_009767 [Moniliophthora roreri]